jgi:hypothetical protein
VTHGGLRAWGPTEAPVRYAWCVRVYGKLRRREGVCSLGSGYDPRPKLSLLRVGMKLSDQDLLKTAEPLIIILRAEQLNAHQRWELTQY